MDWMGSKDLFELYNRPVYKYVRGTSSSKDRIDDALGKSDAFVMMYSGRFIYIVLSKPFHSSHLKSFLQHFVLQG